MNRHGVKCFVILAAALALNVRGALAQPSSDPAQPAPATPPATARPDLSARPAAAANAHPDARSRTYRLEFDTGARWTPDVSGDREKFEEYGEVDDGFFLDRLDFSSQRPDTGYHVEIGIENAAQDDESYRIAVGRRGRYRLGFTYDETPHNFTSGRFLWGGFGTGRLVIPNVAQDTLQRNEQVSTERGGPATNPTADTSGEDAIQQGIVRGMYEAADGVRFGLVRRQVGGSLELGLGDAATAWVRVLNENRRGTRVLGTGSYERWFVGGGGADHTQDRFIVLGAELAEPIDFRTFGVSAGAGIHGERWLGDVEYTLTQFRNFNDTLLWENPFRISDAITIPPTNNAFDRARFVVGQVVLPPNSLAHDVTASGGVDLPMHGRLAASLSAGLITQDEAFQPWTRNTAIIATDATGVAVGPAATAALPAGDLDGEVRTLAGTLSATVRPLDPLHVAAKYRVYRYDGQSSEITWPGYAGFGESFWRRQRNDPAGVGAFKNEVFDYWRHEADLDLDFRVSRLLSVAVMGGWEAWRFSHLRLEKLDEYSAGAGFTVRPLRTASLKATYRYSDRENGGYLRGNTGANPEARGLLNFNWADRKRHMADARLHWSPTRLVSLGALGSFTDEDYGGDTLGGTILDRFRFGRSTVRRWLGSADVTVTPAERLSVFANYTFEHRKEAMKSAAKDNDIKAQDDFFDPSGPLRDNFAPENYWNSRMTEKVNTVGVGGSVQVLPGKVSVDAGYNLSFGDIEVDTWNPSPGVLTGPSPDLMLLNAVAQDWPTITSRQHEVFVDLGYHLTEHVRAGARYLYAAYDLDDFAWDVMQPYMAGISVENSTRFVFADATYNAYQVHVASVYLSGRY